MLRQGTLAQDYDFAGRAELSLDSAGPLSLAPHIAQAINLRPQIRTLPSRQCLHGFGALVGAVLSSMFGLVIPMSGGEVGARSVGAVIFFNA